MPYRLLCNEKLRKHAASLSESMLRIGTQQSTWYPYKGPFRSCIGGTVQVWGATMGRNVLTYGGHASYVLTVAWSPDGKNITSGSADDTVQVWNAP